MSASEDAAAAETSATLPHWPRWLAALLVLVLLLGDAVGVLPLGVRRLDLALYDARLRATMPRTLDDRIVIVDIDEKSLAEVGRWPWSRDHLADLTHELFERQKVSLVGFDVVFAEPDSSSGLARLEALARNELKDQPAFAARLEQLRPQLDNDARFAQALKGRDAVLGYYFTNDQAGRTSGVLPPPAMDRAALAGRAVDFTSWSGYGANLPELAQAAPRAGFFNSLQDVDGVVRSVPLIAEHRGGHYETLALAMFRALAGQPTLEPGFPSDRWLPRSYRGLDAVLLRSAGQAHAIPVDARVGALIPYRGPGGPEGGSFRYLSASDLLKGRVAAGALQGKVILVGTTAPGMFDLRVTPVGQVYPGVEAHANLLVGLMDSQLPVQPDYALGYEVMLLLIVSLGLVLVLPRLSPGRAVGLTAAVLAALVGVNLWLYLGHQLAMPLASLILACVGMLLVTMGHAYFFEGRPRRLLARRFGGHVPPQVLDEMSGEPERYDLSPQTRPMTVLFCDMRNHAELTRDLSAEQVRELMGSFFGCVTEVVVRHRGTLDKYVGDAVMAFWGAPLDNPHHAEQAVVAALALGEALKVLNGERLERGLPAIDVGIGLNTGMVVVGDLGTPMRSNYTVMGEAVDLAARIEILTASYGVTVLAGDGTRDAANHLSWQEIDRVRLRGRERPLSLYAPLASRGQEGDAAASQVSEVKAWHLALKAYRAQDWDQADVHLLNLQRLHPGKPLYALFAYRIAHLRRHPPGADWDGAFQVDGR